MKTRLERAETDLYPKILSMEVSLLSVIQILLSRRISNILLISIDLVVLIINIEWRC